ncbi:hypothetical protein SBV1_2630051 [Verrucomicrobia bacterium]|nr:hypothetical protein SBV1_2630051 [Verrucomicrobiota bacterium]
MHLEPRSYIGVRHRSIIRLPSWLRGHRHPPLPWASLRNPFRIVGVLRARVWQQRGLQCAALSGTIAGHKIYLGISCGFYPWAKAARLNFKSSLRPLDDGGAGARASRLTCIVIRYIIEFR